MTRTAGPEQGPDIGRHGTGLRANIKLGELSRELGKARLPISDAQGLRLLQCLELLFSQSGVVAARLQVDDDSCRRICSSPTATRRSVSCR